MNITTKEYAEADKSTLVHLIESLQQYIVDGDPMHRQILSAGYGVEYTAQLLKAVAEKDGKIFFALEDGAILGFIARTIQPEPQGGTMETLPSCPGWIRELYIHEEARGKGVGSLLMKKLEEYFKSKGCDVVQVGVFAPSADSHAFYQRRGYVDREITMLKKI